MPQVMKGVPHLHVLDFFRIKGLGAQVARLTWPGGPEPKVHEVLKRVSDGAEWMIHGIETHCIPLREGHPVGLLLRGPKEVMIGDELERVP
jgi:hypothetical protein